MLEGRLKLRTSSQARVTATCCGDSMMQTESDPLVLADEIWFPNALFLSRLTDGLVSHEPKWTTCPMLDPHRNQHIIREKISLLLDFSEHAYDIWMVSA